MLLEKLVIPIGFDTGLLLEGIDLIKEQITGAVEATFEWADGLDRLGDVTGMNTNELAAWSYVAKKAGTPISTLSRSLVIFEKGLVKADGSLDTMGKTLAEYGINVFDANGKVKTQSDLMSEIARQYNSFSTQQERVNFLTAIFGRSGAELIDVFDTLASEGGIADVTQKVGQLGLAIDPARYEQFQRNLEEIKMAGLGLQVAFTEWLMPTLEKLSGWVKTFAEADPAARIKMLQDALSQFDLEDLTEKFKNWVASIDWSKLSNQFSAGMNSIDWAGITTTILNSTVNIEQALIDIIARTDWAAIRDAFGNMFTAIVRDGIGGSIVRAWIPAAEQFWALVDNLLQRVKNRFFSVFDDIAHKLATVLVSLVLPWWMTPGSPTPLENGLRGIAGAFGDLQGMRFPAIERSPAGAALPAAAAEPIDYYKLASILAAEVAKATN